MSEVWTAGACRGESPLWRALVETPPALPRCAELLNDWLHLNGVVFGHCGQVKASSS